MWREAPNVGALWGSLIIEELVRNGAHDFIVCPGSRSTPLVQAIARNPQAKATIWLDERGAAFHALGRGRAGVPAVVVTTSGTAVANLLPAVVEASLDGVPMLLLTADRPPELREVGANQSIRQMGVFSDHVRWAFDLPAPSTDMPARALLTTVNQAIDRALDDHQGPVQLNCPFREPLAPNQAPWDTSYLDDIEGWLASTDPLADRFPPDLMDSFVDEAATVVRSAKRGLFVCGQMDGLAQEAFIELAARVQWPVCADIRSGLRLGPAPQGRALHLDRLLDLEAYRPDVVIQLGSRLTSKRLHQALARGGFDHYVVVDAEPSRLDPTHRVTQRYVCEVNAWCWSLLEVLEKKPATNPPMDVSDIEARIEATVDAAIEDGEVLSEPYVARWLTRNMQPEHGLFLSNSMPVRDVQSYGAGDGPPVRVAGNRGASGIDGIVSTASGFAQALGGPTTLLIGDIALLHDINALAMLGQLEQPLTTVVLNNGGGSIFSFLPIAEHQDVLDPYVATPHQITFEGVAKDFDLPYVRVETREEFETAYEEAVASGEHTLIEVASSLESNKAEHERIEAEIAKALS